MASKARPAQPQKCDGFWYLIRRVPQEFQSVDDRGLIRISIRITDDPIGVTARRKVLELDSNLQAFWRDKRDGKSPKTPRMMQAAADRALERQMELLTPSAALALPYLELVKRVSAAAGDVDLAEEFARDPDQVRRDVLVALGSHQAPPKEQRKAPDPLKGLKVSQMIDEFSRINATLLAKKSPNQLKKWKSHRQIMLDKFIELNGGEDFAVANLSREHTMKFRTYWQARILAGTIKITSANRQMRRVAGLYKSIHDFYNLDTKNPFSRIHIPGGRDGKRLNECPSP